MEGAGGNFILNGDNTPETADGTDFGIVDLGGSVGQVFTVRNTGDSDLTLNSITLSGDTSEFGVTQPSSFTVSGGGGSETFTITAQPTVEGERTVQVTIPNNDADEAPFTFTTRAFGCAPATVTPATATCFMYKDCTFSIQGFCGESTLSCATFDGQGNSVTLPSVTVDGTGVGSVTLKPHASVPSTAGFGCACSGTVRTGSSEGIRLRTR